MAKGDGDKLARGASRASYQMPKVSQEKWDAMFADEKPAKKPGKKSRKHHLSLVAE